MDTEDSNIKTLKDEEISTKSVVSRRSLFSTGVLLLSAAVVLDSRQAAAAKRGDVKSRNDRDGGGDSNTVDDKSGDVKWDNDRD